MEETSIHVGASLLLDGCDDDATPFEFPVGFIGAERAGCGCFDFCLEFDICVGHKNVSCLFHCQS